MGMAVCSIGLSLRYRMPITVAWSTPGAALLITSPGGVSYPQAIGAFITSALLVILCGVTGSFERIVRRLPASLAAALLAGILFRIGSEIFIAAQHHTSTVLGMFSLICWSNVCRRATRCCSRCWSVSAFQACWGC